MKKKSFLIIFVTTFVFVFTFNVLFNSQFSAIQGIFYGDIISAMNVDKVLLAKILTMLIGETGLLSGIFYYTSKAIFRG